MGYGLYAMDGHLVLWVTAAGVIITIALVFQFYALSIGTAGVTYAIVNFSVAIQTVILQVILGQMISKE